MSKEKKSFFERLAGSISVDDEEPVFEEDEEIEELKKDRDFVRFLAQNARQYYLENCTTEAYVEILKKVIDYF